MPQVPLVGKSLARSADFAWTLLRPASSPSLGSERRASIVRGVRRRGWKQKQSWVASVHWPDVDGVAGDAGVDFHS